MEAKVILMRYIERTDQLEDTMKREFQNVHSRINHLEGRVNALEQRIEALERKVDEGFARIESTLRLILLKLDRIDEKLADHGARIKSLEDWRDSYRG